MEMLERYRGCLLGLAVGDALGASVEFMAPGTFPPVSEMIGGGVFHLEPGQWTDDTSLALCLAESLVEKKGFDPLDQMERNLRWYREGYFSSTGVAFDIGGTTAFALNKFEKSREPFCGPTNSNSSGNGSLMRLAAVPMFYADNPQQAIEMAALSSKTTHGAIAAVDACRYMSSLIVGALNGVDKEELLSSHYCTIPDYWKKNGLCETISKVAAGSFKHKNPPQIRGTGYVVESLESALWAFYKSASFKEGMLLAVNLGDDADTTGAIYGQLAGAYYGVFNLIFLAPGLRQ